MLRPSELRVDPDVQRRFDPNHAKRIAKVYDAAMFGMGHASLRDDDVHYVLDGQHRVAGAIESGHGEVPVLFRIYTGLSRAEEAELFLKLNSNKKQINALDMFRLSVQAKSPVHCDVQKIVHSFGLCIAAHQREGGISAVVALLHVYDERLGVKVDSAFARGGQVLPKGHLLSRTLSVLTGAWGKERDAFDGILIKGVAGVLVKHGASFTGDRFAKSLAKSGTAQTTIGKIRGLQSAKRQSSTMAAIEVLESIYNYRLRKNHAA